MEPQTAMKTKSFQIKVETPEPRKKMPKPSHPIDKKGYDRKEEKKKLKGGYEL